jgi:hypothetical protein
VSGVSHSSAVLCFSPWLYGVKVLHEWLYGSRHEPLAQPGIAGAMGGETVGLVHQSLGVTKMAAFCPLLQYHTVELVEIA